MENSQKRISLDGKNCSSECLHEAVALCRPAWISISPAIPFQVLLRQLHRFVWKLFAFFLPRHFLL